MLKVENVYSGYDKKEVLKGISFEMGQGELLCILGANGCGKSTLLKNILGILKTMKGAITLDGKNVFKMEEKALAQLIAYIPQAHVPPFPYTVEDVVLMGRTPHLNKMAMPSSEDASIAQEALCQLGIAHIAKKSYMELSGGQRQMVVIARAIAQEPRLLVMDEPTASLDYGNQYVVLEKIMSLKKRGMSILMVTHSPEHALYCAERTLIMKEGNIIALGPSLTVVNESNMKAIYNTDIRVVTVNLDQKKTVPVFIPRIHLNMTADNQ